MAEDGDGAEKVNAPRKNGAKVSVCKDGPYTVSGRLPLAKEIIVIGKEGEPESWKKGEKYPDKENYDLCRCGKSKSKPYCDKTHAKTGFDGTETAGNKKHAELAEKISGPELDLADAEGFCAGARFCHLASGTWDLVEKPRNKKAKELAIQSACNCPSGRLVVSDKKTGKPIEPVFEPSVSLVEDPQKNVSGPIRLKGGVTVVSADGAEYETRNRVTLCRCGESSNKPFCDGSHRRARFNDGDESLH